MTSAADFSQELPLVNATCRLCGGDTRFAFEVRGQRLHNCQRCGYLEVVTVPSDGELAELYNGQYFQKLKYRNDDAQLREQDRRAELLDRAGVRTGGRVLDFGCATGEFLACIKGRYEVYGSDLSPQAIERAKELHRDLGDRLFATTLTAPLSPDIPMLDAIVAWDVIEHLENPVAVICALAERLRPGGILAVSTPDNGALTARLLKTRWAFMTPPEHLGFFNVSTARRLFEAAGIKLERSMSRGKWVNAGFLAYKLRRVFPEFIPERWIERFGASSAGRICLYVPTSDVLYAVGRKKE
jgi:2-polyprenyl-3-methyl-5-hydroxy-6-metoxy-1,4-benzoquinol methylase